jgi:hypothetical protein
MTKITDAQRAEVSAFLKKHTTLVIATLDQNTQAQAASLFYASDDALNLYWISEGKSAHSQNLERSRRIAAVIHNETWDWREIQGAQINGQARRLIAPDEIARARELYSGKFPFIGTFGARIASSSFYACSPEWIRWIDNSKSFGHREEFTLP